MADERPTWREAIRAGRDLFDAVQLGAAVRRNPEVARQALRQVDARSAD